MFKEGNKGKPSRLKPPFRIEDPTRTYHPIIDSGQARPSIKKQPIKRDGERSAQEGSEKQAKKAEALHRDTE
jgi:hypothetical protein